MCKLKLVCTGKFIEYKGKLSEEKLEELAKEKFQLRLDTRRIMLAGNNTFRVPVLGKAD